MVQKCTRFFFSCNLLFCGCKMQHETNTINKETHTNSHWRERYRVSLARNTLGSPCMHRPLLDAKDDELEGSPSANHHHHPQQYHNIMSNSSWRPPTPPSTTQSPKSRFYTNFTEPSSAQYSGTLPPPPVWTQIMATFAKHTKLDTEDSSDVILDNVKYDESLLMDEEHGVAGGENLAPNNISKQHVHREKVGKPQVYVGVSEEEGNLDRIRQQCTLFYDGEDKRDVGRGFEQIEQKSGNVGNGLGRFLQSSEQPDYVRIRRNHERSDSTLSIASTIYDIPLPDEKVFDDSSTVNAEDFSSSSVYHKDGSGKLNYRLPTDNVRLAVVPNLEPGILSMVVGSDPSQKRLEGNNSIDDKLQRYKWGEVSYVLTVDEDLYKRVVDEMAASLRSPIKHSCTNQSGSADIRIALTILSFFFLFLFITTLLWPTQ